MSGNETLGGDSSVHSTYVQYVDGSPDSALYAATNGQMWFPITNTNSNNPLPSHLNFSPSSTHPRAALFFNLIEIPDKKEINWIIFFLGFSRTYPAYTVVESGAMYSPGNNQYYTSGTGNNSITYSQVFKLNKIHQ